ncbi:competence protein CoiA family protein [Paraburkholderia elongata]|uniref:Competence protein CoiA-like family protein n=1 Tax=Paraburkholderia elongata TaxID=2675747 RepID=A0A972NLZ5_9BURK|nr:hypothetical protein [Paraburkholderia elongata]NPT53990.1 hypothetical protein [Paraburkholderia elongata]
MAKAAHIVFAKDEAGNIAAASDLFTTSRSTYLCVACGKELRRKTPENGFPYFVHAQRTSCRLAAHYALRAAAQRVLTESRFIKAPLAGQPVDANRLSASLAQWSDSACDLEVGHVPVDFLAETGEGQLLIELSVPGLPRTTTPERLRALQLPTLEVELPPPADIHGFSDLRQSLLHSLANKRWVFHPAHSLAAGRHNGSHYQAAEPEAPRAQALEASAPSPWNPALSFADSTCFRQLAVTEKLEVLEKEMDLPCDRWPAYVDIEVRGEQTFGVDRRVWQADVFSRFVQKVHPGVGENMFSVAAVSGWLKNRYLLDRPFPGADSIAVHQFLSALVQRGFLVERNGDEPHYRVVRTRPAINESGLVWRPHATLPASQLRVLSTQAGLRVPVDLVQWLLESFDDCHPCGTVDDFVSLLSRRIHAPPRNIIAFLLDAKLAVEGGEDPQGSQERLF